MPAVDIVRPERTAIPATMMVVAVVASAMMIAAVVVTVMLLREGRSGHQRREPGSRQYRTESTKSHS
jgi:hypothetical protein